MSQFINNVIYVVIFFCFLGSYSARGLDMPHLCLSRPQDQQRKVCTPKSERIFEIKNFWRKILIFCSFGLIRLSTGGTVCRSSWSVARLWMRERLRSGSSTRMCLGTSSRSAIKENIGTYNCSCFLYKIKASFDSGRECEEWVGYPCPAQWERLLQGEQLQRVTRRSYSLPLTHLQLYTPTFLLPTYLCVYSCLHLCSTSSYSYPHFSTSTYIPLYPRWWPRPLVCHSACRRQSWIWPTSPDTGSCLPMLISTIFVCCCLFGVCSSLTLTQGSPPSWSVWASHPWRLCRLPDAFCQVVYQVNCRQGCFLWHLNGRWNVAGVMNWPRPGGSSPLSCMQLTMRSRNPSSESIN